MSLFWSLEVTNKLIGSDVTIEHVSKDFGSFHALRNINLGIKKGEFFSLLGPSGCGKTTLLRIIAGFENPDAGAVSIDDIDILPLPPNRRHANTVFQNYALFPHLTVFENVAFSMRLKRASRKDVQLKVSDYLHLVELDGQADKMPSQLSGGQKQRVAIARALINEPSVLLLDEPLSALDAKLRQHMLIELDSIHDKIGITFIYVTHDQQEALSVSDRIAVMDKGNVLQVGTPYEIYESPADIFVANFIGETNLFQASVKAVEGELVDLEVPELGDIRVTTTCPVSVGATVNFTIRPEKIRISRAQPTLASEYNILQGTVEEPIYTGFQTKYFVRIDGTTTMKIFKQHINYTDEGPDIHWKDSVYVWWHAEDGYIVEDRPQ